MTKLASLPVWAGEPRPKGLGFSDINFGQSALMIRSLILASMPLIAIAAPAVASAQEVKPGLWEMQTDMQVPGQTNLSAQIAQLREQMKGMPPETRKMLEQQMGGMSFGPGATLRTCLTPEQAKGDLFREGHVEGDCTLTKVSRRGNTLQGQMVCTDPPGQGTFTTTIVSATHYKTEASITAQGQGRIDMKTDAKWVSADCGATGGAAPR